MSGGAWGGKAVNDQFIKFLLELVGEEVWDNFKMECMDDYLEITISFETKKQTINPDKSGNTRIFVPPALMHFTTKSHRVKPSKISLRKMMPIEIMWIFLLENL